MPERGALSNSLFSCKMNKSRLWKIRGLVPLRERGKELTFICYYENWVSYVVFLEPVSPKEISSVNLGFLSIPSKAPLCRRTLADTLFAP
jgi:hypothetical protein